MVDAESSARSTTPWPPPYQGGEPATGAYIVVHVCARFWHRQRNNLRDGNTRERCRFHSGDAYHSEPAVSWRAKNVRSYPYAHHPFS